MLAEPWSDTLFLPLLLVVHDPWAIGVMVGLMLLPMTLSSSVIAGSRPGTDPDRLRSRVQPSSMVISSSIAWIGPLAIGLLFQYAGETAAILALSTWSLIVAARATLTPPGLRSASPLDASGATADSAER